MTAGASPAAFGPSPNARADRKSGIQAEILLVALREGKVVRTDLREAPPRAGGARTPLTKRQLDHRHPHGRRRLVREERVQPRPDFIRTALHETECDFLA